MRVKFLFFVLFLGFSLHTLAQDYAARKRVLYSKYADGVSFVPLEIGEVKPCGWLRQWAESAADGITGHLDEYEPVYRNGWKGYGFVARETNPEDGTGWPIEQCSYWLDGAVKLAYILDDTALINKVSKRLNLVVDGVLKGGESFIYWKPKSIVDDSFNNWGHGIMGRALVSYYQATHDQKILDALVKVYSNFTMISPGSGGGKSLTKALVRGATNIDAMSETFLMSGKIAILDSIIAYGNRPDVKKVESILANLQDRDKEGFKTIHTVTFYEVGRVPAILSMWRRNVAGYDASVDFLKWGEKFNMMPYGVNSGEEFLSGLGPFHHTETCDVSAAMWFYLWMLRINGNVSWADKMEYAFFNAGPVPVDRHFKTVSYYQCPNRISETLPSDPNVPGVGGQKYTPHGHDVLCCVGSVNWIIPNYISNMWMATMDGGFAYVLYGPCKMVKSIGGQQLELTCSTNYPFDDKVAIRIDIKKRKTFPLYFRKPEWCRNMKLFVNGKPYKVTYKDGFIKINRTWSCGDSVTIHLPMEPSLIQGRDIPFPNESYFMKSARREVDRSIIDTIGGHPYEYVKYGPLLFSLPLKDLNPNNVSPDQSVNYALDINENEVLSEIKVIKSPMPSIWGWKYEESPIKLDVKAINFDWSPSQLEPLPSQTVHNGVNARIQLVPYNCTKFRITMFPVSERTFHSGLQNVKNKEIKK